MKLTENTKVRVKVPKHLYEAIQAELDKKHGMEEAEEVNEYVGMSPDQAQVVEILGSLIAAGGLGAAVKTALQMALDKIKSKKSDDAEAKEPVAEMEEMEETLDLESLMEAVSAATKKKAEDKKKKAAEAKKKKEIEDKKKKEAEAKKKAAAAKKK
jgi:colicin import membrane protein